MWETSATSGLGPALPTWPKLETWPAAGKWAGLWFDRMRTKLVEDALHMAFARRLPAKVASFIATGQSIYQHGLCCSSKGKWGGPVARATGCGYDNAIAEPLS